MDYKDLINLPHHTSKKHQPMTMLNRAAQFAPFAALAGYEDAIRETEKKHNAQNGSGTDKGDADKG